MKGVFFNVFIIVHSFLKLAETSANVLECMIMTRDNGSSRSPEAEFLDVIGTKEFPPCYSQSHLY